MLIATKLPLGQHLDKGKCEGMENTPENGVGISGKGKYWV
jgi:hypothetical protein